jgi:cytochrome c-type biogenesis protein CcmE
MKPKYLLGGALLLMAVAVVITQGLAGGAQYFLTVGELRAKAPELVDQNVRISGVVIGDSITFDPQSLRLEFDIVDVAVFDDSTRLIDAQQPLRIVYEGPRPELLQDQAQGIIEGRLNADGTFTAITTPTFKCPTRYEEQFPEQASGN